MISETLEAVPVQADTEALSGPDPKPVDERLLGTLSRITASMEQTPEPIRSTLLNEVRALIESHLAAAQAKSNLLGAALGAMSALREIDAMEDAIHKANLSSPGREAETRPGEVHGCICGLGHTNLKDCAAGMRNANAHFGAQKHETPGNSPK